MYCNHENFNFIFNLIRSIIIPSSVVFIAVVNFIYIRRKDNRELNQLIYREKFKYTFGQLFNNAFITDTNIYNIPFIHELIRNIISFEKENKFHGIRAKRKFNKIFKLTDKIKKRDIGAKYLDGDTEFYRDFNTELILLRKDFMKFYKIIFGAV